MSPADDLVVGLDREWVGREMRVVDLEHVRGEAFPAFLKPVVPKLFRAWVYRGRAEFPHEVRGLPGDTRVIASEVVRFDCEARAFILEGRARACSVYEGCGDAGEARAFAARVGASLELPRTCVIDIGFISDRGWGVVEFNAAWGSGLSGCRAADVVGCIAAATRTA